MEKILLFVFAVISVNILVFFLIPNSSIFMFNLNDFVREPWRYLTFQFFHTNTLHLIENIVGLLFVGFLAKELDISFKTFLIVYFVSVFIIPIPLSIIFSQSTVAGNSMGIFGVLGFALIKGRKLIPQKISIPMFLFFIFSLSIFKFVSCGMCYEEVFKSDAFHFCGFVCGVLVTFVPQPKAKQILRVS